MSKTYLILAKPGIILGNIITTAGGFFLASTGPFEVPLFLIVLTGLSLLIASSCVFNNYIDRQADQNMERTKYRPLAKGSLKPWKALVFGTCLGILGSFVLGFGTNLLTLGIAIFGFCIYVLLYSFAKYKTVYATLIGSLSGAVPPVVGYCAVTNRFDSGALCLYLLLVLWQMPHFYAIAMYRAQDYRLASIPVFPLVKGAEKTKLHMSVYILLFCLAAGSLTYLQFTGFLYLMTVVFLSLFWLVLSFRGFKIGTNDTLWARTMFRFSLVVITLLNIMIAFDKT